ncbi:CsbD family protein [Pseudoalteromonas mariniglutinosa]|uniref:CsbD family protein n=1 Tax=Pseudoalteromonas mariniglutinosa TaxID=206042 RepID=UPI00385042D5
MSSIVNRSKPQWKQQVPSAKAMWGRLSEDELLKTAGHHQKLVRLIQERYLILQARAEQQVNDFFNDY